LDSVELGRGVDIAKLETCSRDLSSQIPTG